MTNEQIKEKLKSNEYEFLRKDKNLGNNIIILTLGGSHAYGTNNENSDLDIRGCALNSKMQILTNEKFEQFTNEATDTTIYSFKAMFYKPPTSIISPQQHLFAITQFQQKR